MRALITGGAGFVGSHLVQALLDRGDDVVCIERPGSGPGWVDGLPVRFSTAGLADVEALRRELAGVDVVFHLAALTQARRPRDYYDTNTEGTANLLRAMTLNGDTPARIVFMSSLAAAGPCRNGEVLTPDAVPCPLSHYGHSKLLAEAVVHAYADRVPAVILRFPPVYGPRERALLMLFQLVRRRMALTIGDWEHESSLVYVDDAVRALLAAGTARGTEGRTWCVAHPQGVTWRQFALAVGRALSREPVFVTVPRGVARVIAVGAEAVAAITGTAAILNRDRVREMTQRRWICDGRRAMTDLGYTMEYDVAHGVTATAAWYEEAAWL
jgi:dihydroflavonol-4-reductase